MQRHMGGKSVATRRRRRSPTEAPSVPEDGADSVMAALSGHVEAVFLPWIADRFTVEWLDVNDDRLGMTA